MALAPPSEEEILRLVAERESLRQARRFAESDGIRERLRALGVELYDKEREWRARDGRRGELFTAGPARCTLSEAEIREHVARREDARAARDWASADALRDELRRRGVELDDRARAWRTSQGRTGAYGGAAAPEDGEVLALVAERERARARQDFAAADGLRLRLLRLGVELFDAERAWRSHDGRRGVIVTGGAEIVRCALGDAEIQARVRAREEARAQRSWEQADLLRDELRRLGVELIDAEQRWQATDGRSGPFDQRQHSQWPAPGQASEVAAACGDPLVQAAQGASGAPGQYAGLPQSGEWPLLSAPQAQAREFAMSAEGQLMGAPAAVADTAAATFAPPAALSHASIQALVDGHIIMSEAQDMGAAEAIRHDLWQHGVELLDEQGAWRAADGREGCILAPPGRTGLRGPAFGLATPRQRLLPAGGGIESAAHAMDGGAGVLSGSGLLRPLGLL